MGGQITRSHSLRTITRSVATARHRLRRYAAGGLLAMPLLIAQCDPGCEPPGPRIIETRQVGTSIRGRPITAYRLGTPGGKVVLAVGSIHGDEQAGIEIVEHLRDSAAIPAGFDVWIIPTINPDGNVIDYETNAAGVDLNRNFPVNWQPIDCVAIPLNCAGPSPLSEPESQSAADFLTEIQPRVTVWYHAVGSVVDRATQDGVADPAVLTAYAREVGYAVTTVSCGPGGCTGNATQFQNATFAGTSAFVVELSTRTAGAMSPTGVANHTEGFWAAAAEG
ncbi:MAG: M14 family zinc carboxypeptidase [Ilumatobacteraceae bacterium]